MNRVKRIEKIGSTTDIPYTRSVEDVKKQRWVMDRFYRLMGRGALFWINPDEQFATNMIRGSNYFDLLDTSSRIHCIDSATKENIRKGKSLESFGNREEKLGHLDTACEFYYRACHFYVAAAWGILDSDDEELIWLTERIRETFDRVVEFNRYPMERVEIPFEGKTLPGILTVTHTKAKAPTIIVVPGMDDHKELPINHLDNPFVLRGMNTLVLDGPGQGESLMRKIWVDRDNYGKAGKASIDYLVKRPEVDAEKIGVFGVSMGTYWASLIAMHDIRVKAVATHASCFYNKDHIFNEVSPNFRLRFMWMTGNLDDKEFDEIAKGMTMEGKEDAIRCPFMIFHGEFDHLTNTLETYNFFDRLGSNVKQLRIYEGEYHGINRFLDEIYMMAPDWLRDQLDDQNHVCSRKVVFIDWNRKEHPVNEEALKKGFSYIRAD